MRAHSRNRLDSRGSDLGLLMRDKILYNDANYARCDWSLLMIYYSALYMDGVTEVLFNLARGFKNVCEIISDWASESFVKV